MPPRVKKSLKRSATIMQSGRNVADPVEGNFYEIGTGGTYVKVSDFVSPAFFEIGPLSYRTGALSGTPILDFMAVLLHG